ncbi:UPF0029-domain-containing protein [Meredithblackwellia eburnea MCA 4105]
MTSSSSELPASLQELLNILTETRHVEISDELASIEAIYGEGSVAIWSPSVPTWATTTTTDPQLGNPLRLLVTLSLDSGGRTGTGTGTGEAEDEEEDGIPIKVLLSLPPSYPIQKPLIQLHNTFIGPHTVTDSLFGTVVRTFMHDELAAVGGRLRGRVVWREGEVCLWEGLEEVKRVCGEWFEEREREKSVLESLRQGVAAYQIGGGRTTNGDARWQAVEKEEEEKDQEEEEIPEQVYIDGDEAFARKLAQREADAAAAQTEKTAQVEVPNIISSEPIMDRKSVFVGHAARVKSIIEVKLVINTLLSDKKIARAAHNISAYRFKSNGVIHQDNDDDGETAAGSRMAHLMSLLGVMNVVVVVTRWYGGIHLGSDRFRHINAAARDALDAGGFIEDQPPAKKKTGKKKVN